MVNRNYRRERFKKLTFPIEDPKQITNFSFRILVRRRIVRNITFVAPKRMENFIKQDTNAPKVFFMI